MRALTALIVGLVGTLHGNSPGTLNGAGSILVWVGRVKVEIDETSLLRVGAPDSRRGSRVVRSSLGDDLGLQSEIAICYQRQVFSCGQVGGLAAGELQKRL